MQDKWLALAKDLMTLSLFIAAFYGLVTKFIDAWEKRKTAEYKELEGRVKKCEECCEKHTIEHIEIKTRANEIQSLLFEWFKK